MNKINKIFREYIKLVHTDHREKDTKRKEVKKLLLKALESGHINIDEHPMNDENEHTISDSLEDGLNNLLHYFQSTESKDDRIKRVYAIRDKFASCIKSFCEDMGIQIHEFNSCKICGTTLLSAEEGCLYCIENGLQS